MTKHAKKQNTNGSELALTNKSREALLAQNHPLNELINTHLNVGADQSVFIDYHSLNAGWKIAKEEVLEAWDILKSTDRLRLALAAWVEAQKHGCVKRLQGHFCRPDSDHWKSYLTIPPFSFAAEREFVEEVNEAHSVVRGLVVEIKALSIRFGELGITREPLFDRPTRPDPVPPRRVEVLFWYLATFWSDWTSLLKIVDTGGLVACPRSSSPTAAEARQAWDVLIHRVDDVDSWQYETDKDKWREQGWIKIANLTERRKYARLLFGRIETPQKRQKKK